MERDLEHSSTPGRQSVWNSELRLAQGNLIFWKRKIVGPSCMASSINSPKRPLCSLKMCFSLFRLPFLSNARQQTMWEVTKLPDSTTGRLGGESLPLPESSASATGQRAAPAVASVLRAPGEHGQEELQDRGLPLYALSPQRLPLACSSAHPREDLPFGLGFYE